MSKALKYFVFICFVLLFLNGCRSDGPAVDLFQYKDSYVGDNSAVSHIIERLQKADKAKGFELETKTEPYGMLLNYEPLASIEESRDVAIYNATFIFALVQNADWVKFDFGEKEYEFTKEELEEWYGEELNEFTNEVKLRALIQEKIDDEEKVAELLER